MFNLSEEFKNSYSEFLSEEFDKEYSEIETGLEEAYEETKKSMDLLENYFNACCELNESMLLEDDEDLEKKLKNISNVITSAFKNNKIVLDFNDETVSYTPEVMFKTVTKAKDMKFPENIIFFLKQLITWLKNLVIAFISKITNMARKLIGLKEVNDSDAYNLKLDLSKKKDIELIAGLKPIKTNNKYIELVKVDADDVKTKEQAVGEIQSRIAIKESEALLEFDKTDKIGKGESVGTVYGIKIDISDDMDNLKALVSHFFNVFDASYGSNGEYLFGSQDLEMLLKVFKTSMDDAINNRTPQYEVQGRAVELVAADKDRLRLNLEKTLANTEKLKALYKEVASKISTILKVVTHKQLIAATDMGVSFKFYSAATYEAMIALIEMIQPRLKDAEKLEKQLVDVKERYEKLTLDLGKLVRVYGSISGVTYQTIQQRTITNLFDAARSTTQTVTLRLTTLSLYIKTLKDINEAIKVANAVNYRSKNLMKEIFA
jgi:hypothetical protein